MYEIEILFHNRRSYFSLKPQPFQGQRRGDGHSQTSSHSVSLKSFACALYMTSRLKGQVVI